MPSSDGYGLEDRQHVTIDNRAPAPLKAKRTMKSLTKQDLSMRSQILCKYNRHVKSRPKVVKCVKPSNKSLLTLNRKALKLNKENEKSEREASQ